MTKKIILGVAGVALAGLVMAPSASANCIPAKSASTFAGAGTAYWNATEAGTLVGQFWQLGAPAAANTGTCTDFVYFTPATTLANLNLNLGDACAAGCPASGSTLAVLAVNKGTVGSEFLLDTVVETPAGAVNFDYGPQGDHAMIPIPRPKVLSSGRAGTVVNANVQIDSIAAGLYGPNAASAVTGFRILTKSSGTDPGRDAASYDAVPAANVASPGGATATTNVAVDCSNPANDQWLVTQIVFEGGVVASGGVSASTRVKCDPAIANPKYKIVPKKLGAPKSLPN